MVNCMICGQRINGYGNNAEPIAKGKCCDFCNNAVAIARFRKIKEIADKAKSD